MLRVGPGRLVFGAAAGDHQLNLYAKAIPDTLVRRVPVEDLLGCDAGDEMPDQVDAWLTDFGAAVAANVEPRARPDLVLEAGMSLDAPAGSVLSTRPGQGGMGGG